jgi:ABC-type transporter Mla maintaining outer membrane lipid asymmetry permease subunit MlaE
VSDRAGAGVGAELASMKVAEQIDAIEACSEPLVVWMS